MLLLGPISFVFLVLTPFVTQMLFYVQCNGATHQIETDGQAVVKNRFEGAYYRVMTALLFGAYHHHNHYLCRTLVDPCRYHEAPVSRESEATAVQFTGRFGIWTLGW